MIAVICAYKREFNEFINKIPVNERNQYRCIMTENDIRGVRFDSAITYGQYWMNNQFVDLAHLIELRVD